MPGLAFPPVGRLGLASPPSPVLCSATTATRPSRWPLLPLGHRYLVCSFCSCPRLRSSSLPLRNPCVNARPAWSPGTPFPGCRQGNKWLSQVPRLPLCLHAPLFDPGGVLNTRPYAFRTAAFHPFDGVGFPAHCSRLSTVHDYTNFEAQSRGLLSRSPWLRTPVTGLTRRVRY
jgi:hypothetical protein